MHCTQGKFCYTNASAYGYSKVEKYEFFGTREMSADEYTNYCSMHCTHIMLPEPYRTLFFEGLRKAVLESGNKVVFKDTYVLYLTKKPKA